MTQKICFDCFHKLFPDKPIRKVTLGRQCVVCKAQTDRTEQMVPVEAEDIPLVTRTLANQMGEIAHNRAPAAALAAIPRAVKPKVLVTRLRTIEIRPREFDPSGPTPL